MTGDTIDIMAAFGEFGNQCFRVTFFDNEVESIQSIDPVTGQRSKRSTHSPFTQ